MKTRNSTGFAAHLLLGEWCLLQGSPREPICNQV